MVTAYGAAPIWFSEPAADADPAMRGFVGVAFRVDPEDSNRYECFYLRPTNARADVQLRRNHTTQYVSHPDYPWYRLREESRSTKRWDATFDSSL